MPPDRSPPPVHVAAAVLRDARGRVLLARRTAGRDLAGLWEFPGGKVEPGESPIQALERELAEELGIRVRGAKPLIAVPQRYPDKRIVLDVYEVPAFAGTARGLEKQALAWAPPEKLAAYPMPPADRPVVAALTAPSRYLITPEPEGDHVAYLASLEKALAGGVRRVQLRARSLDPARFANLAREVLARCRVRGAELLLNGSPELAAALGTGVHLRAAQLMALSERPLPPQLPVAASCHDAAELAQAERLGLDFVVLGPVRATESHPGAKPLGWDRFRALREQVSLPIYALGGMKPADVATARRNGAQGIAAIRGLWPK
ncbi:Nudix family hydrolase [Arenimonas fontis]|uniref:8-oxo-dGTP diphosphatase n=1 Tax=Arenimonas fontis TaxID=2608255 RepID=A0A5B2ZCL8_9GAMM|nr:Nudix family hydrolase [Arenimonas fontis]KAA2284934.1 Nudix family hydrolase [Arenimonas fontis]